VLGDVLGDSASEVWIVARFGRVGALIFDRYAAMDQMLFDSILQLETCVVGAEGDLHEGSFEEIPTIGNWQFARFYLCHWQFTIRETVVSIFFVKLKRAFGAGGGRGGACAAGFLRRRILLLVHLWCVPVSQVAADEG
jgi:hypothetical protein